MKKFLVSILAIAILNVSIATVPFNGGKTLNAYEMMIPIGKTGKTISLYELSKLKPEDYEKLANVKLNSFDKVAYKLAMKKLKKSIAADGTVKNKKIVKMLTATSSDSGFHLGGFALGFLAGLIGVLVAYVAFSDDNKSNRIKWSWIGLGAAVVLTLILVLAVLGKVSTRVGV